MGSFGRTVTHRPGHQQEGAPAVPKLPAATAKSTTEAESATRENVPEGIYTVRLRSVESKPPGPGSKTGKPFWLWTFEIPEDAEQYGGKRFFLNTSLADSALWKMKEVFDAFGVDPDTDTDELVGDEVRLVISIRPIGSGARAGQPSNQVENVLPLVPGDDEDQGDGSDEPPF
jgi:hypothetical protein